MYIVIAGGGMVGGGIAARLQENKHDVILIDKDKETCDKMYAQTGVIAINASVTSIDALKEAGIEKADSFVAATGRDADNLTSAILAKSLGVPQIIVRMRDPAYEKAYQVLGVNTIVRVTDLLANQVIMEIEKPEVRKISSIGSGRADIFAVTVPKNAKVSELSIQQIAESKNFPAECTFVAVYNIESDEFAIPRGQQIINEGDEIYLISATENIKAASDYLRATK